MKTKTILTIFVLILIMIISFTSIAQDDSEQEIDFSEGYADVTEHKGEFQDFVRETYGQIISIEYGEIKPLEYTNKGQLVNKDIALDLSGLKKTVTIVPLETKGFDLEVENDIIVNLEISVKDLQYTADGKIKNNNGEVDLTKLRGGDVKVIVLKYGLFKIDFGEKFPNVDLVGNIEGLEYDHFGDLKNKGVTIDPSKFTEEDNVRALADGGFSVNGIYYPDLEGTEYEINKKGFTAFGEKLSLGSISGSEFTGRVEKDQDGNIVCNLNGYAGTWNNRFDGNNYQILVKPDGSYDVSGDVEIVSHSPDVPVDQREEKSPFILTAGTEPIHFDSRGGVTESQIERFYASKAEATVEGVKVSGSFNRNTGEARIGLGLKDSRVDVHAGGKDIGLDMPSLNFNGNLYGDASMHLENMDPNSNQRMLFDRARGQARFNQLRSQARSAATITSSDLPGGISRYTTFSEKLNDNLGVTVSLGKHGGAGGFSYAHEQGGKTYRGALISDENGNLRLGAYIEQKGKQGSLLFAAVTIDSNNNCGVNVGCKILFGRGK